uniref:Band 7 domain-containing protein n=1 Tax=Schistocephalus solidus TaxID=70667 RepID=A0A0X3P2L8_SCHSO
MDDKGVIDADLNSRRRQMKRGFSLVPERFSTPLPEHFSTRGGFSVAAMLLCEEVLKFLSTVFVLVAFPFSLLFCFRVIPQYERAVIFRLGRLISSSAVGPGLIFKLPFLDRMRRVDLRTFTFDVPTQEVLTKDSVTVAVEAVVYYRIFDPIMAVVNVENANRSTRLLAQTTLRNVLGTVDLYSLLTDLEEIAAMMQETLDSATDTWGVKVERVEIKDVRLPLQLQRAMAAEAEATREARAKVIAAKGEEDASRSLKLAAQEIAICPIALQLRYLQTLASISAEKNSTIVFPLPMDLLSLFRSALLRRCVTSPPPSNRLPPGKNGGDDLAEVAYSSESLLPSSQSAMASPASPPPEPRWPAMKHSYRPILTRGTTISTNDSIVFPLSSTEIVKNYGYEDDNNGDYHPNKSMFV